MQCRRALTVLASALLVAGCVDPPDDDAAMADDDMVVDDPDDDDSGDDDTEEPIYGCESQPGFDFAEAVLIEGGVFSMGSDEQTPWPDHALWFGGLQHAYGDETPAHDVELGAFCIERYEVTLERYEACVDQGICDPLGFQWNQKDGVDTWINHYPEECWEDLSLCLHWPVNAKHRAQAALFCDWAGGRLCTEAEWERVASGPGPDKPNYPWGDQPPDEDLANVYEYGDPAETIVLDRVDAHPAGASAEGVFDLTGNVFEWVSDWVAPYEVGPDGLPAVDPTGPPRGRHRIARGGCGLAVMAHEITTRMTADPLFDGG